MENDTNQIINLGNELVYLDFGNLNLPEVEESEVDNDTCIQPIQNVQHSESESDLESGSSTNNVGCTWSDSMTKLLIHEYKNLKPLVESGKIKTLQKMWQKIQLVLREHKYEVTATQVESKWKSLERAYKKMLENKTKTGRGRKSCPFHK